MWGTLRTLASALLLALAPPVGGVALLAAVASGLTWAFAPAQERDGAATVFVVAMAVLIVVVGLLARMQSRARRLVAAINATSGLRLDPRYLLGSPSPVFVAFDRAHRQLVIANASTGTYRTYPFHHVLRWSADWTTRTHMQLTGTGDWVQGTHLQSPTFTPIERDEAFALVLDLADPDLPQLAFPMSERAAVAWCARLNALFNG